MRVQSKSGPLMNFLTTTVMILVLFVSLGDNSCPGPGDAGYQPDLWDALLFWFGEKSEATAGNEAVFELGIALMQGEESGAATLSWTPPEGAGGFQFVGLQPTNPEGPPPFLFVDPPVHATAPSTADVRVLYVEPAVAGGFRFIDSFLVAAPSGAVEEFNVSHDVGKSASIGNGFQLMSSADSPKTGAVSWRWNGWFYNETSDLERGKAENLIDYFQSGDFFVALRFPVPQSADVLSYRAPVVMKADYMAHIAILDHSMPWGGSDLSQAVADLELEYDPAHQGFLENALPRQDQTRWAALRPKADAINIEDRFPISADYWELFSTGLLSFNEMPDSCSNCELEVYYCHEGAEEPAFLDFTATKRLISYQGRGITCFGPVPERLTGSGSGAEAGLPLMLEIDPIAKVDPATQGSFLLNVVTTGDVAVSVNLDLQSSSGLDWELFRGDWDNPDLGRPFSGTLQLSGHNLETLWVVGDIPADARGLETIRVNAVSASDPSKNVWTTITLWIGEWTPPETEEWSAWIPVASHAAGAQGSAWRTDLGLLNSGTVDLESNISLMPAGEPSITRTVAAGSQLILGDVVDQLGTSGAGSLKISAPGALMLTSRTYSQVGTSAECLPDGTLGQSLASSEDVVSLSAGQSALIPQLVENSGFRTNIAATNTGETDASVRIRLFDGAGTELAAYEVDLSPGEWKQEGQPFFRKAGETELDAGYAEIEVLSGSGILGYGSVVDNVTNDPTTMALEMRSGASARSWIPVASHASGANDSAWRTDLGLLNPGDAAIDAEILYHASDGLLSLNREIPAGGQLILADVVDLLGVSGAAALEVSAGSPLIVTSRTYSQVSSEADCYPGGTLGQSLVSTASAGTLPAGQSALLPQLTENASYRSNLAVINTGTGGAEVRVHLMDATGTELASYDVLLDPGQWKQENQPFFRKAGQDDMEAGYALIEVVSGNGISAYASVVDNITNDPTTIAMIK